MEKLTKQEIWNLTKGPNREKNVRAYIARVVRRSSGNKSRKRQRDEMEADARKKLKVLLEDFLECRTNGNDMLNREIAIFKPKFLRLADIDRDCNFSETSSNAGSSFGESSRPRRMLTAPERFYYDKSSPKPKVPKLSAQSFDPEASFEVEAICDINLIHNQVFVQVKWEDYPSKDNTWEPLDNVKDCDALQLFVDEEMRGEEEAIGSVCQTLLDELQPEIEALHKRPKSVIMQELKQFDPLEFKCYQLIFMLVRAQPNFYHNFRKKFRHMLMLNHFHELDIAQRQAHKKIKWDIMEKEANAFTVSIVNEVDFTILEYFNYLPENIPPADFHPVERSDVFSCECPDGCSRKSACCPSIFKGQFAYKKVGSKKRLRVSHTQMIFECDDGCACDADCTNRVTQQPRLFPLQIFKTHDGRGWGLKTAVGIPKGTFLMQYTGEIIDQDESVRRGEKYDEIGLSYLFDLDFNDDADAIYTIDAFKCGNLSRLINHSCEPNCRIWPVTTCKQDPQIYKLCYFSSRSIKAGEELTFDYNGGVHAETEEVGNDDDDDSEFIGGNNIVQRHKTVDACKCGSAKCRGFIFN